MGETEIISISSKEICVRHKRCRGQLYIPLNAALTTTSLIRMNFDDEIPDMSHSVIHNILTSLQSVMKEQYGDTFFHIRHSDIFAIISNEIPILNKSVSLMGRIEDFGLIIGSRGDKIAGLMDELKELCNLGEDYRFKLIPEKWTFFKKEER